MTPFEFATARKIIFGRDSLARVAPLATGLGSRVLLITGRKADRAAKLCEDLQQRGMEATMFAVSGEPTVTAVMEALRVARERNCDLVIALGGGSVIDTGKAVAALATNKGELLDYLEIIGRGRNLENPPLPCIAVPTTAGTGTEVTANAVIKSPEHGRKVSLRGGFMIPSCAVVDPGLTLTMPPSLTAATGMDALTQLIEAFVSRRANPVTDALCREGLALAARSLARVYVDGNDLDARDDMALAALLSGMALADAGLGAVHGLAAIIGGMFDIPHGVVCARLLSPVMEANFSILRHEESESSLIVKGNELSRILTGKAPAKVPDGLAWLQDLGAFFKFPLLRDFGLQDRDFRTIAGKAVQSSSIRSNPVNLSEEDLVRILKTEQSQGKGYPG